MKEQSMRNELKKKSEQTGTQDLSEEQGQKIPPEPQTDSFGKEIPPEYFHYQEMTLWQRFTGHLKTVHIHRKHVREGCFRLGLYWQGLTHDLSKYSPSEFIRSVKYYDGHRSPNAVDRRFNGFSGAWLHHKGRNRHHYEYWIDFMGAPVNGPLACKMPLKYVAEMVCDRRAACMAYHGKEYRQADAWEYYAKTKHIVLIHPDTRAVLERALLLMRDEGEEAAFAFLKGVLAKTKDLDYTAQSLGLADAKARKAAENTEKNISE